MSDRARELVLRAVAACAGIGLFVLLLALAGDLPKDADFGNADRGYVGLVSLATVLLLICLLSVIKLCVDIVRMNAAQIRKGKDPEPAVIERLRIRPIFRFLGGILGLMSATALLLLMLGYMSAPWERWIEMMLFSCFFLFVAVRGKAPRWFSGVLSKF